MKPDNMVYQNNESEFGYFPEQTRDKVFPSTEEISFFRENLWESLLSLVVDKYCAANEIPLRSFMDDLERRIIVRALYRVNGDRREAARLLGVKYTTLHEKLKKFKIRFKKKAF